MSAPTSPPPAPDDRAPRWAEVWLWHACEADERSAGDVARAFEDQPPDAVLAPPRGRARELAAELAGAWRARLVIAAELEPELSADPDAALERASRALGRARAPGAPARSFYVLALDELRACFAAALTVPLEGARNLFVDPGRLVLLVDGPLGFVLRRANVVAPEVRSGSALPSSVRELPARSRASGPDALGGAQP